MKKIKVKNHKKFACFKYDSKSSKRYELGDVVTKRDEHGTEIGVIIQIHDNDEYRTDMFGNCHFEELHPSTELEIKTYRPELYLLNDINI